MAARKHFWWPGNRYCQFPSKLETGFLIAAFWWPEDYSLAF